MGEDLTLADLSRWTGEPVERLRQWRSLGLIGVKGAGAFRPEDAERVRLVQLLLRRGIGLEVIARVERDTRFLGRYLGLAFPEGVGPTYSLAEVAELVGVNLELLRRVWAASGFAEQGERLGQEDIDGLRQIKAAKDAGFPEEALMQAARVYADALGRVAEMEARLFHFYIHERLKAEGLFGPELLKATETAGEQATAVVEPVILYYHRKGLMQAAREDVVGHLAEEAGLTEKTEVPGQLERAIAFVDLSSFTPLTEAMGDEKAAEVLERFSTLVRECAGRWDGRVVKQLGDAFMLVFPQAQSAVVCALEIEERTAHEPQFPSARCGVHWGRVLYREGDYVGTNVNIAARVAAEAERHQVLVTSAVRTEAKGLDGVEFVRAGKRRLKGLSGELVLFAARAAGAESREQHVDPVCGMEMAPDEVAARLNLEGVEHCFCSDECLRKYVSAPEKYR